jgi:PAS domain S-box-containing protein
MFLLISGLVLLLTAAAFVTYEYLSFRQATRNSLSTLGRIIAANSTASLAFANAADAGEILSALRTEPHVVAAALYDTDGHVFATYPADLPGDALPAAPAPDGYRFEQGHLVGFQPVAEASNQRLGTLYLVSDLGAVNDTFRLSGLIAAAVMGVALLTAYLLSAALQGRISKPVLILAETARTVSDRRDYSVRAPELGRDELGVLTKAFNHMLGRIEDQDRALRESKERLDLALQSAGVGTWTWDVGANALIWDDFLHPLFGLLPKTFPGRYEDFLALVHPDDRERVVREGAKAVENDAPYDTEYRVVWPDRSERVLASRGKVHRDTADRTPRMTGVCWDITERRRGEELRRKNDQLVEQNQRVQEANRLKSEFLANMSHELRTPLNAIIGFAELMHDGKVGAVSAHQQEYLDDILTSSRHLLQLINDVLDLSKVEAGKMEFRPEPVDLAKVFGEVKDILRTMAAQKQIRVEVEIDAGVTGVLVDPAKLKQVLYNYLSNALKFTPDAGRVVVRATPEGPEAWRLEVEDTGFGIRPEDLDRLFVEFQQLDASMAKKHAGTGLGLALTKRIVEAQGGQVAARSAPRMGSVFSAVLPRISRLAALEKPAASHPGPTAAAFRVLVIEDNPRDQERIARILSEAGYAVEAVATGTEGLARCGERRFDAITLDLLLPDMHGRELLQAIRKPGPNRDTPVIVVTVVSDKAVLASCLVDDLLCKPIRGTELLEALRRATVTPGGPQPILVIDDDPEALELAGRALLELGYRPICVSTADALRKSLEDPPAAVVVDPLTTELDGFAFLSQFHKSPAGRRVPIILCTLREIAPAELHRHLASARSILQQGEGGAMLIEAVAEAGGRRRGW